ncbi:hypothetical protein [Microbacterium sp. LBN7]|uniref:hypothetical protein n=1 Tax=Microbacterium sp. LBN7 TaxID=3129773 RepID=UPI003248F5F3
MKINDRNLRTPSRLLLALPIAALAFSLAACGGPSRPSEADVAKGLAEFFDSQGMGDQIDADAAECLAEYLVDSELSNETLTFLANGEDKQKNEADKALTTQIISDNVQECIAD